MACSRVMLVFTSSFCLSLSLLFTGAKSEATLKLTPQYPTVGSDLRLECVSTAAPNFASASVLQLQDSRTSPANLIYQKSSNCSLNQVDLINPRISLINSDKLELQWTNMSQLDTSRYYCYVENCQGVKDRSGETQITVIAPPSYVNITPAGDITAKEGSAISLSITCHANVGSPDGSLSLTRSTNSLSQLLNLTLESTGSLMIGTYTINEVANRNKNNDWFQCKAFNQLDSSKATVSDLKYLKVSYQPTQLEVTSVPMLPIQSNSTSHSVTVPSGLGATIFCLGTSNPMSQLYVNVLSGNDKLVKLVNGSAKATIEVIPTNIYETLQIRCTAKYADTSYPELDTTLTNDIEIYITGTVNQLTSPKPQEVQSDDSLVWIIVGVVCGVLLLGLVCALIVWCIMKDKSEGKDPNANAAAAAANVAETVVPVNARAVNAEPDYDIRKEFPPDLLYLADEPKSRRPIVDFNAQSMFEYLGDGLVAVQSPAYTEKTPYETENDAQNAYNVKNDQFDQYDPNNLYDPHDPHDPNQLAANQYDANGQYDEQSGKQAAYNANQAYDKYYHNQAKQSY